MSCLALTTSITPLVHSPLTVWSVYTQGSTLYGVLPVGLLAVDVLAMQWLPSTECRPLCLWRH